MMFRRGIRRNEAVDLRTEIIATHCLPQRGGKLASATAKRRFETAHQLWWRTCDSW